MHTSFPRANPRPRQLPTLQIPAIDLAGNGGLGWEDLKDPHRGVAMFAITPVPVSQPGNSAQSVNFTVNPGAIAPVMGKCLQFRYVVTRNGVSMQSQALELEILPLPSSSLPAPQIEQALEGSVLHVASLSDDADLRVAAWPFIAAGQRVWLRFEGTRADGTANNWYHSVWQHFAITSDADQHTHLGRPDQRNPRQR